MTWVYDLFTAVPYLRFLGEPGTGKSRMLQVAGHLAYKGIFAGGATTSSPLFRLIEVYRGTLVIDEADYKASDTWTDIIKILNAGYMKGVPVLRSEKVGTPRTKALRCLWAEDNRESFPIQQDGTIETRCITLEMDEQQLRPEIPRQLRRSSMLRRRTFGTNSFNGGSTGSPRSNRMNRLCCILNHALRRLARRFTAYRPVRSSGSSLCNF